MEIINQNLIKVPGLIKLGLGEKEEMLMLIKMN